ncbi:MAG: hypothetical protein RIF46_01205 [Cyclobacteriaceae bacterium]
MLEYFKTVLSKVSFDKRLFEKELKKALNALIPDEVTQLRDWCYAKFSEHEPILEKVFVGW